MQHVVQLCPPQPRSVVAAVVIAHAVEYSTHKFASNVVEKCLQYASHTEREALIHELLGQSSEQRHDPSIWCARARARATAAAVTTGMETATWRGAAGGCGGSGVAAAGARRVRPRGRSLVAHAAFAPSLACSFRNLDALVRDPFGNYVLQRTIEVCSAQQRSFIAHYAQCNAYARAPAPVPPRAHTMAADVAVTHARWRLMLLSRTHDGG